MAKNRTGKLQLNMIAALEYLFVIFLILDGNSIYHSLAYLDLHFPVVCVLLAAMLFLVYGRASVNRRDLFFAVFLVFYFSLYFLIKYSTVSREVYLTSYMTGVPILYLLFRKLHRRGEVVELFYKIENVMTLLAVISVFFWLSGSILHVLEPNMSAVISWGRIKACEGYFGLQFETGVSNSFGQGLPINSGMFSEGPMFNLWLDIALATELFLKPESSRKRAALFILTILTTLSTTGIFFITLTLALKYVITYKKQKSVWKLVSVAAIACVLPVTITILQSVFYMKAETSSFYLRMQDYVAGFKVWQENPLFGSGYGFINSLQKYVLASRAGNVGFSNSIMAILGTGGIWNMVIYFAGILIPVVCKYENKKNIVCFIICYAYLTVILIFYARFMTAVFVAFGLSFLPQAVRKSRRMKIRGIKKLPWPELFR